MLLFDLRYIFVDRSMTWQNQNIFKTQFWESKKEIDAFLRPYFSIWGITNYYGAIKAA